MNFFAALEQVQLGKRITRVSWNLPGEVVFMADGFLKLRKDSGKLHELLVSAGDMDATDWVVVREQ